MINQEDLKEFITFLSFPSISSEAEYKAEIEKCFAWLKSKVEDIGFKTKRWETGGHPAIFAESEHLPGKPTLLIYNHYDVQPVDPLELWDSPPFEPVIKDNTIYARGAQDNKGQLFYTFLALKSFNKKFPINIKWIIEGEEEVGSKGLDKVLEAHSKELKSDHLAIVDCGIPDSETPAVSIGMRGLITFEIEASGTKSDLHSGTHGGVAYNPNRALTELLGHIFDKEGKITIPHYYDSVIPLTEEEKRIVSFEFDEKKYIHDFGAPATGGEKALKPLERNWLRPSFEINGIWGGYIGQGFKTVIPAKAYAKVSCRLVKGQDPQKMLELIKGYLESVAPPGIKFTVTSHLGGGPAIMTNPNAKVVQAFAKAFTKVFNKPCKYILEGASIPIVASLSKASGAEAVLVGVGLATDQIHAPNEHFGLDRFEKGRDVVREAILNL